MVDHVQQPVIFRGTTRPSSGNLAPTDRPLWPGTIGPVGSSPGRAPGSVRRTTSVDIVWPEGAAGPLHLHGLGRDLITRDPAADPQAVDVARLDVRLRMPSRAIIDVALDPDDHGITEWMGGQAGHFRTRRQLDHDHPDFVAGGSVAALLIDEIPAATLISGSSMVRGGFVRREGRESGVATGVCAGWIEGGSMHVALASLPFFGEGPPAPLLTRADDPLAWHQEPAMALNAMRRRRRIDVRRGTTDDALVDVDVFFRDSIVEDVDGDSVETVIHEYGIDARVDPVTRRIVSIAAIAHVLPGPECPSAVASAQRLVGMSVDDVRAHVRDEFRGTTTCTHLNDALRSIGDLGALLAILP